MTAFKNVYQKKNVRSCHSPTYNPSVASRFTLKTHSLYYSCKVLLHLAFALLSSSTSYVFPFDQYSSAALAFFCSPDSWGCFFSLGLFHMLSPCPSQLFPGSSPERFHLILHFLTQMPPCQRDCALITMYS